MSPRFIAILRYAGSLVIAYFVTWTTAFAVMMASRGEPIPWYLYWHYLSLAWSFQGLELPMLIWFCSLVAFIPLAIVIIYILRRFDRVKSKA